MSNRRAGLEAASARGAVIKPDDIRLGTRFINEDKLLRLPLAVNSNALYIKIIKVYRKITRLNASAIKKIQNSLPMSIRSSRIAIGGFIFSVLLRSNMK